ncbi:hypothetical protein GE21DRAFT_9585 [Neurospora crassa]|uniref:C2H2-type domain-containing protein n=1 Tax=Neurospora crassa (strain ATCC 24698 / 74-OR23-1A / CBS 708.71 / DSM 1257 / FGSC 987) TaxID=367110 RepID=Q7RX00_NEUCR|nr:hypothetical protein NCU05024 [Neurospora crassa OR74A]EAA27057.1 hypothetical protein NCU05024 [Neurospora crassa OR74A]KHE80397.1 hypothetical protein GE21DRAFT_9585 [Neurospora crassa]|eukprot:XP_956293.1 hypothetical protein NCU05024 [Neurospora crassa OR74A]
MDYNHFDLHHPLPVTDNDISNVYNPLLGFADDGSSEALSNVLGQSHESTNQELDITSSYPIANSYTCMDSPPFVMEGLSGYDWSQHIPPTTGHFQDLQDEGVMQSLEGVDGNTIPVLDTVYHDNLSQPSAPAPPQTVNLTSLERPTVRVLESSSINPGSLPSSTPDTTSRTPSPSGNEGRSPNTRATARYHCTDCGTSSQTKRDHERHLTTKKHQKKTSDGSGSGSGAAVPGFHCLAQGCEYSHEGGKTFTREDNLWRHMKTAHPIRSTA